MPTRSIAQANWRRAALSVAAVNGAIPDGLTSRDRNIAEPVRQRWYEGSHFVEDELNTRHVPVTNYGTEVPRAQQLVPGG